MIKVSFRIPSGGGGMVQGMASGELAQELQEWVRNYTECDIFNNIKKQGYHWTIEFINERDAVAFIQTFNPKREHWWNNAKIER